MRLTPCLFALASLAAASPAVSRAQEEAPPRRVEAPPPPRSDAPPPRFEEPPQPDAPPRTFASPPPDAPPPPRQYQTYPRPAPGPRHYPRPYYYPRTRYWGWGWYPLYPAYPPPPPAGAPAYPPGAQQPYPPGADRREEDRVYTRISAYGSGHFDGDNRLDGYMGGLTFGIDSRYAGFDLDVAALARDSFTGPLHASGSDPATWATAHITWTLIGDRSFRFRLETGASMLALPSSPAVFDRAWRGKTVIGPDVGISGQLGLTGPVGIEGYARYTPFPVRIADTFVGVTVHGGPLGVNAGWRWVDVAGDEIKAPKTFFRGPQAGVVLAF